LLGQLLEAVDSTRIASDRRNDGFFGELVVVEFADRFAPVTDRVGPRNSIVSIRGDCVGSGLPVMAPLSRNSMAKSPDPNLPQLSQDDLSRPGSAVLINVPGEKAGSSREKTRRQRRLYRTHLRPTRTI
jgi:hypothetical protein